MSYLIDTNVISEFAKKKPSQKVVEWLSQIPEGLLYLSVITIGEIRYGIERLAPSKRKEKLKNWLEGEMINWFDQRILPIELSVTDQWGRLQNSAGRTLPAIDSLIAATALQYNLELVTRNEKDFQSISGLTVINPWK